MPLFTPDELAEWTGGTWSEPPAEPVRSVSHDTRELQPGAMYVALPGERVDGHDLISAAKASGAAAVLCLKGRADPCLPCLEVPDTGEGLKHLAKGYRKKLNPRQMIGITGSAGKTTVKDFLSAMLSAAGSTRSTRGNWNNFIGLPLSLLAMEPKDRFGVFELGMNRKGEIADLAAVASPDAAIITSIGEAHLEQLGSVEAIAEEKTSLFAALSEDDFAIVDADSPWAGYMRSRCPCRMVEVSMDSDADYRGEWNRDQLKVCDRGRDEVFVLEIPLPGEHMVKNLLQAVAMARECGLTAEQIRSGLEKYAPAPMRWQTLQINGLTVINDAYNANPLSMRKSLRTFSELDEPGEKWLVLGGMSELGRAEKELHWVIGKEIDSYEFSGVILVGEKGGWIGEGIQNTRMVSVPDTAAASEKISERVRPDSLLLLKASRSERLEEVVSGLRNSADSAGESPL